MTGDAVRSGAAASGGPWRSQSGQDRFLDREIFHGRRDGVFVEAGEYDGVTGSNTAFFERVRGWRGLLVEPSPSLAAHARRHRDSPVHEVALAPRPGHARFIDVHAGYRMMGGLECTYPADLLHALRANARHEEQVIDVPTRPLAALLDEAGLTRVDLVSLDIEGGEMAVLEDFAFHRFHVDAWCIENHTHAPALPALMERHGYLQRAILGVDEIYVRRDARSEGDR